MTVKAQRRAASRKARRAQWRRRVRFTLAVLRREYGPDFDLFRIEDDCPCGGCRTEEAAPGWLRKLPPDVRAAHEAHTAAVLLLWELRHWRPEQAAALRRVITAAESVWSRGSQIRRALLAAGIIRAADDGCAAWRELACWLEVCLRTGPPLAPALGSRHVIPP